MMQHASQTAHAHMQKEIGRLAKANFLTEHLIFASAQQQPLFHTSLTHLTPCGRQGQLQDVVIIGLYRSLSAILVAGILQGSHHTTLSTALISTETSGSCQARAKSQFCIVMPSTCDHDQETIRPATGQMMLRYPGCAVIFRDTGGSSCQHVSALQDLMHLEQA